MAVLSQLCTVQSTHPNLLECRLTLMAIQDVHTRQSVFSHGVTALLRVRLANKSGRHSQSDESRSQPEPNAKLTYGPSMAW